MARNVRRQHVVHPGEPIKLWEPPAPLEPEKEDGDEVVLSWRERRSGQRLRARSEASCWHFSWRRVRQARLRFSFLCPRSAYASFHEAHVL